MLVAGIVGSLFNGFDYEEAIFLTVMLVALLPCRREFYRKSSLIAERFSPQWTAAVLLVIVCAVALAVFVYKKHEYSHDLWWEFELHANAPRTLRALTGAVLVIFVIAIVHLLQAKHKPPGLPSDDNVRTAMDIARRWPRIYAQLVALGDKSIVFNHDHSAFMMYAVEGRSWVVLGDPVGDDQAAEELAWEFRELCDEGGRWPVFYQVETNRLPLYIDLGLSVLKLGEEARVPLTDFGLEGRERKSLRHACTRLEEREGCSLEIVEPPLSDALLAELEVISNDWLKRKNTREKGFSLGFFDQRYLQQFPMALVRQNGRIIAFANVLRGGDKEELSIDLMRLSIKHRAGRWITCLRSSCFGATRKDIAGSPSAWRRWQVSTRIRSPDLEPRRRNRVSPR